MEKAATKAGARITPVPENLVDAVWTGRPASPAGAVVAHPLELAGESVEAKLSRIREALGRGGCDALVISDPHNLAWAFNLRGGDVAHTPLALGYAVVPRTGRAALYLTSSAIDPALRDALSSAADIAGRADFDAALAALAAGESRIRLDSAPARRRWRHWWNRPGAGSIPARIRSR